MATLTLGFTLAVKAQMRLYCILIIMLLIGNNDHCIA